jgi:hypothetical protein
MICLTDVSVVLILQKIRITTCLASCFVTLESIIVTTAWCKGLPLLSEELEAQQKWSPPISVTEMAPGLTSLLPSVILAILSMQLDIIPLLALTFHMPSLFLELLCGLKHTKTSATWT